MATGIPDLLESLRKDIASHEAEIAKLRAVEDYLAKHGGNGEVLRVKPPPAPKARPKPLPEGLTKYQAAETILRTHGQPMRTIDIAKALDAEGYGDASTQSFISTVFTAMHRKPLTFKKAGRGMWGLTEWESDTEQ